MPAAILPSEYDTVHVPGSGITFSDANTTLNSTGAAWKGAGSVNVMADDTGTEKYYAEFIISGMTVLDAVSCGIDSNPSSSGHSSHIGDTGVSIGVRGDLLGAMQKEVKNGGLAAYGNAPTLADGDVIGIAVDLGNNAMWVSVNDSWIDGDGTDSSATVKSEIEAGTTTSALTTSVTAAGFGSDFRFFAAANGASMRLREKAADWSGSAPSGFNAISNKDISWDIPNSAVGGIRFGQEGMLARSANSVAGCITTWNRDAGKWHFEIDVKTNASSGVEFGIFTGSIGSFDDGNEAGDQTGGYVVRTSTTASTTSIRVNGADDQTGLPAVASNSILSCEYDADANEIKFFDDGTQIGTTITGVTSGSFHVVCTPRFNSSEIPLNMGQSAFGHTPSAGFIGPDDEPITADISLNAAISLSGDATSVIHADGSLTGAAVLSGNATSVIHADGSLNAVISLSGDGKAVTHANGTITGAISLSGTATNATLHADGSLNAAISLSGTSTNATLHADGSLNAAISLSGVADSDTRADGSLNAAISLSGGATVTETINAAVTIPTWSVTSELEHGAFVEVDLPVISVDSIILSGAIGGSNLILPTPVVSTSIDGGTDLILPSLIVSATGLIGQVATFNVDIPKLTISSTATISKVITADINWNQLIVISTGHTPGVSSTVVNLPNIILNSQVINGTVGTVNIDFPDLEINSVGYNNVTGTVDIDLPILDVFGVLLHEAQAVTTSSVVDVFAMNIENIAVTEYNNFPFHTLGKVKNNYIGMAPDGVYLLDGDSDEGNVDIDAEFLTGLSDFGTIHNKRIRDSHIGYRANGDIQVSYIADRETDKRVYTLSTTGSERGIRKQRVKMSRGVKSNYYQVGVSNVNGSDFEIDHMQMVIDVLKRRVY